jgi:hypothetical protein
VRYAAARARLPLLAGWTAARRARQQRAIRGGSGAPGCGPSGEQREARGEDGRLHLIEPAVHAHLAVMVTVRLPAVSDALQAGGERRVAGRNRAAVAERAQVLRRVETVGGRRADRSDRTTLARGQVRLAAVLDDREATGVGDGHDRAHVRGLAVEVHGKDRRGSRSDRGLDRRRADREAARIDVGEDRPRPRHHARKGRVGRRHRRRDYFVAGPDAEAAQDDRDRVGARADADRVGGAAGRGELLLERLDLRAQHVPAAIDDAPDGGVDGRAILTGVQAHERDGSRAHGTACPALPGSR